MLLDAAEIPYYVTGGVAASYHGEPRATRDLGLVIQIDRNAVDTLATALIDQGFYVPEGAVDEVKRGVGKALNIAHQETLANADILVSSAAPFDESQMSRRELTDLNFYVCSAEDMVLQELRWSQQSFSEKQWRDVQGIIRIQGESLDLDYLEHWADQIEVRERLEALRSESGF